MKSGEIGALLRTEEAGVTKADAILRQYATKAMVTKIVLIAQFFGGE